MKYIMISLFTVIFVVMWSAESIYGDIPKKENNALRALFNDTGGNGWRHKINWENAPGTEHAWFGLTCDADNSTILKVELPGNNLQGKLPSDLGDLANLTTIDLGNNNLTGPIPSWLQQLKNLKKLDLSRNRFEGPIPTWIGKLENLEELLLDDNLLEGSIPAALGNLSKLKVLRLGSNGLTGEIPPALAKLSNLMNNHSNFKWNGLYTTNAGLGNFLKQKQSGNDWESSQTIVPEEINVISQTDNSIILSWKPIAYKQDKGGYQISYSVVPGGPYKKVDVTDNKTISKMEINELDKSTVYYFVLQTWTDPHSMNKNRIESGFGNEFRAATRGIIISGIATTYSDEKKSQTEALQGIEITASNNGGTTETDKNGKYSLNVMTGWAGTVIPSAEGFDFSPHERVYPPLDADIDNQNFTATSNTIISGKAIYKGEGIEGVKITIESKQGKTFLTETDKNGNYEYIVPYNWSGTVTPKKVGYRFKPEQKVYGGIIARVEGEDYGVELPAISGRVTDINGKTGIEGVRITFSNIETDRFKYLKKYTDTDSEGNYVSDIPDNWFGSAWPSKKGYIFFPSSRNNITRDDVKLPVNFKADRNFNFFLLISANYLLLDENRYREIYGSGPIYPGIAAGYKFGRNIYIWSGYTFFSINGKSNELKKPTKWRQLNFSFGCGYHRNMSLQFGLRAGIRAAYILYSEKAFGDKVSANALGIGLDVAGIYKVSRRLFSEISFCYIYASDTVEKIPIQLGGFKTEVGLGLRF